MKRLHSRIIAFAAAGLAVGATLLPLADTRAQEVVQQLPDPAAETLNDALRRLSRNPESVPALVAAGRASLDLDDVSAALGFFTRAQNVAPEDGRVLVGLALIAVRRGEPVTALQLFANADAAGEPMAPHAAERGLAYDLVGRNDRAQRLYRQALSRRESPEVLRRLALSYAIGGNADASEATLLPLLQRQDRAAYRTRAFALAIQGRDEEAIAIAETMLPQRLSLRLAPYLRFMPQLTRAQQAAAANLGRFPAGNEVGRDTPAIAALAEGAEVSPPVRRRSAAERLAPQGTPLGQREPGAEPDGADPAQGTPMGLEEAFADFTIGSPSGPGTDGAVDITSIEPRRESPAPAQPARHWVQVATGQDIAAFRFDWRRIVRNADGLLDDSEAFSARWGQTNRLLTGPFATEREAQEMVSALAGAGVDSFRFDSREGEEIGALD